MYIEAFFEVVAGEDEQGGFAGGKDVAVIVAFDAAKFGKVAAGREVLGDDFAEEAGLEVWGEGEEEEEVFVGGGLVALNEARQRGAVVVE